MARLTESEIVDGLVCIFDCTQLNDEKRVARPPLKDCPNDNRNFICLWAHEGKSAWAQITMSYRKERLEVEASWRGGKENWRSDLDKDWASGKQYLHQYNTVYIGENQAFIDASHPERNTPDRRRLINDHGIQEIKSYIRRFGNFLHEPDGDQLP